MLASNSVEKQIADLMAKAIPEQIVNFKFSNSIQKRINILVQRKKVAPLSFSENEELQKYLKYDLLIGLAKAKTNKILATL